MQRLITPDGRTYPWPLVAAAEIGGQVCYPGMRAEALPKGCVRETVAEPEPAKPLTEEDAAAAEAKAAEERPVVAVELAAVVARLAACENAIGIVPAAGK